jgi:gamma-glutamyl:cysteine ligase YbdK (ATP-grasp superfamily)
VGLEIDRDTFTAEDEERFAGRLRQGLTALEALLARPYVGEGPVMLGAELELSLIDAAGSPLGVNLAVLDEAGAARLGLELNRFNIELNTLPVPAAGDPFGALEADISETLAALDRAVAAHGGRAVAVGILPTLREADLQSDALTDMPRYRALSARIRALRQAPFRVHIEGVEDLTVLCDDVTLQGANTSMQIHLQVPPRRFAAVYNAAQIATGPVMAAVGNSPVLLNRLLWDETRVALFRQAVDEREPSATWRPARVGFGHGWVRSGALELFAESVALHSPLLPVAGDEDPVAVVRGGGVPALEELRLHHGTVWRWNRAVYDPADGGHVRVELRALPSGPTMRDMMANAALLVGLTLGLADHTPWMTPAFPFRFAEHNFVAAARRGLDATLLWPARQAPSPRPVAAAALVADLLPVAAHGLAEAGVDAPVREELLGVVRERVRARRTGARWQRLMIEQAEDDLGREQAVRRMLTRYITLSEAGEPVHAWPLG